MSKDNLTNRPSVAEIEQELQRLKAVQKKRRTAIIVVMLTLLLIILALYLITLWYPNVQDGTGGMEPTIELGDRLLINNNQDDIERGDIIAFDYKNKTLFRRVLGLPGDSVYMDESGKVYINGEYIEEPYVSISSSDIGQTAFPVTVPTGCYFVLGDNRSVVSDSRLPSLGFVESGRVLGKAFFRIHPIGKIGLIK